MFYANPPVRSSSMTVSDLSLQEYSLRFFLPWRRFQCEYGPLDRTCKVKKEVDKIFSSALKTKLSTNQKNAKKRVQKQEKKAAIEAAKVVAAEARKTKGLNIGRPPAIPPPVIAEASSDSNSGSECPGLPRSIPGRQRRAGRVQAGMTSKHGCLCNFVAKQLYMDNSLCKIQYHGMNHFNRA